MLAHEGYGRNSDYTSHGDIVEREASQNGFDQDENDKFNDNGEGFGLGLLGLASPTLPSDDMVVPPLNFSMVRSKKGCKNDAIVRFLFPHLLYYTTMCRPARYCVYLPNISYQDHIIWYHRVA